MFYQRWEPVQSNSSCVDSKHLKLGRRKLHRLQKIFYGSTSKAFENASRSDLINFLEMQNSIKSLFFSNCFSRDVLPYDCCF